MTREEHIYEASKAYSEYEYNQTDYENGFINGAKWADRNPNLREEPNLESLWHDASEEPKEDVDILFISKNGKVHKISKIDLSLYDWLKDNDDIKRWAYISDLLPKGGEK